MGLKAIILGATGLVGGELLIKLLADQNFDSINALVRRPLQSLTDAGPKLSTTVLDFENLKSHKESFKGDILFCALGTTRKKAGSKEAFLKIDLDYPIELAQLTMNQPNFQQFLLVSSLGANSDSPLFYNETKGKLEDALIALDMKALKIFQPSLLLGKRDEFRFLEEIGKFLSSILSFFVVGSKKRLWSIKDEEVADSMYQVAKKNEPGLKRYKPNDMLRMIYSW